MKRISDKTDGYNEIDIFCFNNPQAINGLIIVFVSREGWGTAITVIETNCKASNLIPISLVERCRLYHRESNFLLSMNTTK